MTESAHITVLLKEAVDALVTDPNGFYVDGTFGRGGHSQLILQTLSPQGQLLAIDKDLAAVAVARKRFEQDARFEIAHSSFADLAELVAARCIDGAHGVTAQPDATGCATDQLDHAFARQRLPHLAIHVLAVDLGHLLRHQHAPRGLLQSGNSCKQLPDPYLRSGVADVVASLRGRARNGPSGTQNHNFLPTHLRTPKNW